MDLINKNMFKGKMIFLKRHEFYNSDGWLQYL